MLAPLIILAEAITVHGGPCTLRLDAVDGHILSVASGATMVARGASDLWQVTLRDGTVIGSHAYPIEVEREGLNRVTLTSRVGAGTVVVRVVGASSGIDFRATCAGLSQDVLAVGLPCDLAFQPSRVVFPSFLGVALKPAFFKKSDVPSSWRDEANFGPEGLRTIAGLTCRIRPDQDRPTAIEATETGRETLGDDLVKAWQSHPTLVNRPTDQVPDRPLLTSENGTFFGGHRVGAGWLYRFAGGIRESDADLVLRTTLATLLNLAAQNAQAGTRRRIVLLDLKAGPLNGGWAATSLPAWRTILPRLGQASVATDVDQLRSALADPATLAIINPYGESLPVGEGDGLATLQAVKGFLTEGGVWFETGGYPFYRGMHPRFDQFLEEHYPSRGFSDFARIESGAEGLNIYGVQDAHAPHHLFVPVRWQASGEDGNGHLRRVWQTFVRHGESWTTPILRFTGNGTAPDAIRQYAMENGIDVPIAAKMSAPTLKRWQRAVHVKLETPTCLEDTAALDLLPDGEVIHSPIYLHGGFDKQYPDVLPPNPKWGSPQEFTKFIATIHDHGSLFMPYTNHSWWCDEPKGPTFVREGDAPLLRDLEGKTVHEQYGPNGGWSISPFHSAVVAATDAITEAFLHTYPADVLFQDQTGARGMQYDTNPASPAVYAFNQGLIDLAARTARQMPIATEDGFDRLANIESEFCGLAQNLGATTTQPYLPRMGTQFSDDLWEFFPIAQYIAHDKAFFIHHDLESGERDEAEVAWALALGYGMSTVYNAGNRHDPHTLTWIRHLDDVQKELGPRYMGAPLRSFRYLAGSGDHGVMEAVYGNLRIVSNLTAAPFQDGGVTIQQSHYAATSLPR